MSAKSRKLVAVAVAIIVVVAAIVGVWYYYFRVPPAPKITEVVVGAVQPISGKYARYAAEIKDAFEIMVPEINEKGIESLGGAKIRVVWGDVKDTPETAMAETERLITTYKPVILYGSYVSKLTLAGTTVAEKYGIPYVSDGVFSLITGRGYKWVFQPISTEEEYVTASVYALRDYSKKKGIPVSTVGIATEDSEVGIATGDTVEKLAKEFGWKVVFRESYPSATTDLSPLVGRLKDAAPDAVFFKSYPPDGILMMKTIYKMGYNAKAYHSYLCTGYSLPEFIDAVGFMSDYWVDTAIWMPDLATPYSKSFAEKFISKYGYIPTEPAGCAGACLWTIKEILELSGRIHPDNPLSPDSVRDAILKLDVTTGPAAEMLASGRVKFDPATGRNLYLKCVAFQVVKGDKHTIWPLEVAAAEAVYPVPKWAERG